MNALRRVRRAHQLPTSAFLVRTAHPTTHRAAKSLPRVERNLATVSLYPAPQSAFATLVRTAHPTMHNAAQSLPRVRRNPVGAAHGRDPLDDSTPIRGHGTRRPTSLLQMRRSVAKVALCLAPQSTSATLVRTAHPTMRNATQPLSQAERNPVGAAHGRDSFVHSTPIRGYGPLLQTAHSVAAVALYPASLPASTLLVRTAWGGPAHPTMRRAAQPHRPMESAP
jgi:hypothetical protein